jgi:hypothetical protein
VGWQEWLPNGSSQRRRALRFYRKYGFKFADWASLDGPDDPVLMKEIEVKQNVADNAGKPRV